MQRPAERQRWIAYYRVSTDKQGRSGLGLEAQQTTVADFIKARGGYLSASYTEVESGRRADRPELGKAIEHARRAKARLVVAKLDRLTRDTVFLLTLLDGGTDVAFCDLPDIPLGPMGRYFLTSWVAIAELERGLISDRTKRALGAYKARGGLLGAARPNHPGPTPEARRNGSKRSGEISKERAEKALLLVGPKIRELRGQGLTLQAIATQLNAEDIPTARNRIWTHVQVLNVLRRPVPA
jgi:DNA invertase Pin-like site-specific DNA recombinase